MRKYLLNAMVPCTTRFTSKTVECDKGGAYCQIIRWVDGWGVFKFLNFLNKLKPFESLVNQNKHFLP
jgi:hypothetical protein